MTIADTGKKQVSGSAAVAGSAGAAAVRMQGIVRRFGNNIALDKVDFDLKPGEIHALLGENGAGKSTLMHILSGSLSPSEGTIHLFGELHSSLSGGVARNRGIAMVHQHFALAPALTVAENLALDTSQKTGFIPRLLANISFSCRGSAQKALAAASELGWHLEPDTQVRMLSVGQQQRVEIAKALATDAQVLIFDEPTAVLIGTEIDELFDVLRKLRAQGRAIVLIAHKLSEIMAVADRVTVLRRGRRVAHSLITETSPAQLAEWMVGEAVSTHRYATSTSLPLSFNSAQKVVCSTSRLVISGDRGETAVTGVDIEIRAGEIVGIGGVDGNGQAELAEALVGIRPLRSGSISIQADRTGYIPQDRRRAGLAVNMTVADNLCIDAVQEGEYSRAGLLRTDKLRLLSESLIEQYDIRTPSATTLASALSGGNQQKIVVARALHADPEFIVAVNPTRGLDIGATRFVHDSLLKARQRGAGIVVFSTDLDELAAVSDRTLIMAAGKLAPLDTNSADATDIGLLLGGLTSPGSVDQGGIAPHE